MFGALGRDPNGAIMVIGVFMAVFLLAVLYYVIGIGDAVLRRERMQDAVDAASLSAAVIHARGMNVIVLINIVMAALMAVLVGLKMIESLMIASIILVSILSFFTGGSTATAIPPLKSYRDSANRAYRQAKREIFPILEQLHSATRGIRAIVPSASELRVLDTVISNYGSTAYLGAAMIPRSTLPTEDDKPDVLCEKAGQYVGKVVTLPINVIAPGVIADEVSDLVSDAAGGLAEALSSWFCGDGSVKLPDVTVKREEKKPTLPARQECITRGKSATNKDIYDDPTHIEACNRAEKEEQESTPDDQGDCQFKGLQVEESLCDPYWVRASLARTACRSIGEEKPKDFLWQRRKIRFYYLKTANGWIDKREVVESELMHSSGAPCDKDDWEEGGIRGADPNESIPVCSEYDDTQCINVTASYSNAAIGTEVHACFYDEVAQVLGCKVKVEEKIEANLSEGDKLTEEEKNNRNNRVTQKFEASVELGDDDLQLRAVVFGRRGSVLSENAESVLQIATWGQQNVVQTELYGDARRFGRLSIAQAEYYFAGKGGREDWMWHMAWRARFKRFRLPEPEAKDKKVPLPSKQSKEDSDRQELRLWNVEPPSRDFELSCDRGAKNGRENDCNQVKNDLDILNNLVVH